MRELRQIRRRKLIPKTGPKLGADEFELVDDPTPDNPGQKRLNVNPSLSPNARGWMIVKEDFNDPTNPIVEVVELE